MITPDRQDPTEHDRVNYKKLEAGGKPCIDLLKMYVIKIYQYDVLSVVNGRVRLRTTCDY